MPTTDEPAPSRYRLESLIGSGEATEVHRARDTTDGRTVAFKCVSRTVETGAVFLRRFLDDARLASTLRHPYIVPVEDFGEVRGVPYLVMPLVPGVTLTRRLAAGVLPPERAVTWIGMLADALDYAHGVGVVHRDVKPGNVLIDRDDRPLLGDFGLGFLLEATGHMTATGVVFGTPRYLAPELAQGGTPSPASDLYALASVAYEMLCGRTPFEGDTAIDVVHRQVTAAVPPIASCAVGLPVALDQPFGRALDKRPGRRYGSCREFAEQLTAVLTSVEPA